MDKYEFKKIVALCPHCLHTLKNDYAALGADLDVVHASELVVSLIRENKINLRYPMEKSLTIHDPCYLGRINNIYTSQENRYCYKGIEVKDFPGDSAVAAAAVDRCGCTIPLDVISTTYGLKILWIQRRA